MCDVEYEPSSVGRPFDEQAIRASGIAFTFLRPNLFMQGLLAFRATIATRGAFYAAAGDAAISAIDVRDIAEVAAIALLERGPR